MNAQQVLEKIREAFPEAVQVHEGTGQLQFCKGVDAEEMVVFVLKTAHEPDERYYHRKS